MSALEMEHLLLESAEDVTRDYEIGDVLGFGSFSTVYRCTRRTSGEAFACKVIEKSKLTSACDREDLRSEVQAMQAMRGHANVVQLVGMYEDADNVQLVLELCEGGDLFGLLEQRGGGLPEAEAADIFRQIMEAVAACHSAGIMHRDLKLENVLLSRAPPAAGKRSQAPVAMEEEEEEEQGPELGPASPTSVLPQQEEPSTSGGGASWLVKLADFGLAARLRGGEQTRGLAGSAFYMAPEVSAGKLYGLRSDMWSAGVVLYALLTGELPFAGTTHQEVHRSVLRRGRMLTVGRKWWAVSPPAKGLVQRLLEYMPAQRPGPREVLLLDWVAAGGGPAAARPVSPDQFLFTGQRMGALFAPPAAPAEPPLAAAARDAKEGLEMAYRGEGPSTGTPSPASSESTSGHMSDSPAPAASAAPERWAGGRPEPSAAAPVVAAAAAASDGRRRVKGDASPLPASLWKAIFSHTAAAAGAPRPAGKRVSSPAGGKSWRIGHRNRVMCSSSAVPVA